LDFLQLQIFSESSNSKGALYFLSISPWFSQPVHLQASVHFLAKWKICYLVWSIRSNFSGNEIWCSYNQICIWMIFWPCSTGATSCCEIKNPLEAEITIQVDCRLPFPRFLFQVTLNLADLSHRLKPAQLERALASERDHRGCCALLGCYRGPPCPPWWARHRDQPFSMPISGWRHFYQNLCRIA